MRGCEPTRSAISATLGPLEIAAACALLALAATQSGCRPTDDRMAEIRALQEAGRFEQSIAALRDVLAETPEVGEANYRLGIAFSRTGNPSRAVWALEKASESSDFSIPADLELASIQLGLENFEESIRASDRVLARDPNHREALGLSARAHVGARQLEAALLDTSRLLELEPDDYATLVVHATALAELGRLREAEAAHERIKRISAAGGDRERAGRGCLAPALFARQNLRDLERAERLYEDCASKYPASRSAIGHIANFFDEIGRPQRGIELLERAVEQAPDDLALRFALASRLARLGRAADAQSVLEAAVDRFGVVAAGEPLARHYRQQRDPQRALALIEAILRESGGEREPLQFIRADLLVDLDELERAEALAARFEEPSYASMIRGRILLARGNAEAALAAFDEGIESWPDNAGARYLAGIAALELGDFERATVELRESVRVDESATQAARMLARLYFDQRRYDQAIAASAIALRHGAPGQRAADLVLDARAHAALGEFDGARAAIRELAELPGRRGEAAAELAAIERSADGPAAAVDAVERFELDLRARANEPALGSLASDLASLGHADRAIALIDDALRARPGDASLHALRGAALARAGRPTAARSAFERALAIDADCAEALAGLAELEIAAGEIERAVDLFDRAAAADPASGAHAYAAARILLAAGDRSAAEARLRAIVARSAGQPEARNDLAWLLASERRDLDLALSLAREASRMRPEAATLDTLGLVHLERGEIGAAIDSLERAVADPESSPTAHYHLAIALRRSGDPTSASEMLKRALAVGDFPEADTARRQLAELERR